VRADGIAEPYRNRITVCYLRQMSTTLSTPRQKHRNTAVSTTILLVLCLGLSPLAAASPPFEEVFTGRALRFDYYHSGIAGEEHISLHRLRLEGSWPGRRSGLDQSTGFGKYRFEVFEPEGERRLYSHGFSSIYGEWETTGEARRGFRRSLHESQRFPEPKMPVELVLSKRQADGTFAEIYRLPIDPQSRFVDRSQIPRRGELWPVFEHGDPAEKVDLLVLGDGYTTEELPQYRMDVRHVVDSLFAFEPFSERLQDFNVWAIDIASEHSGISRPRTDFWNRTPLGLSYNAFDLERYMLTFENERLREVAALAPYDALILIANSDKYGGGGIYNLYSTAAAKSGQLPYLIVHEFGHAFAGLGDEYYTSQVSYEEFNPPGTEPWEPNITALLEAEKLKWKHLVEESTPVPTPWDQETYDRVSLDFQKKRNELRAGGASEERMEEYFAEVKRVTSKILEAEKHYGVVGAFEGASYEAQGLYRPAADCIMFSRNPDHFCPVCSEAIERVIDSYIK